MDEMLRSNLSQGTPSSTIGGYSLPKHKFSQVFDHPPIRLFIVEPSEFIREAVSLAFDSLENIEVIGKDSNGLMAVDNILSKKPDLIICSNAADASFFEMLAKLKMTLPETPVLMLADKASDGLIQRALAAGCKGIMNGKESLYQISSVLSKVIAGEQYFSAELSERMITEKTQTGSEIKSRKSLLSPRELEVLCCVARGMKAKSIGSLLNITSKTVERHKSNIMAKLGLSSQVDLAIYAVREGYVEV